MYKSFFGLSELPFSISPNPKYFYLSSHHKEALSMLRHGIADSGGFVLFTGEVGTGKTVILRTLLNTLPEDIASAVIYDPALPLLEMLEKICEEFGIGIPENAGKRALTDLISDFLKGLHAQGKRAVLLIDEAQLIPDDVVEQVRLLTNIETDNKKILQVILVGQPELQEKFRKSHMRQVAQRITARFHLLPLSQEETDAYLRYRMQAAGCVQIIFTNAAVFELYRCSRGIPRIINVVADRALLAAFVDRSSKVERRHMKRAIREVLGTRTPWEAIRDRLKTLEFAGKLAPLAVMIAVLAGAGYFLGTLSGKAPEEFSEQETVAELRSDPDVRALQTELQDLRRKQKTLEAEKREQTRFAADILNNSFEESSWKNLVQIWGVTSVPDDLREAWKYLAALGYRCLRGKSALSDLERYNVPAVVQLMDKKLTPFYAVLLRMNEQYAVILMNGREWIMPREWLEDSFEGDFTIIWPLPDGFAEVDENSSPRAQELVFDMLRRYDSGSGDPFVSWDADVQNMVSSFQQDNGLPETGTADIETLWALLPYADTMNPLYNQYILPEDLERARHSSGIAQSASEHADDSGNGAGTEENTPDTPSPADLMLEELLNETDGSAGGDSGKNTAAKPETEKTEVTETVKPEGKTAGSAGTVSGEPGSAASEPDIISQEPENTVKPEAPAPENNDAKPEKEAPATPPQDASASSEKEVPSSGVIKAALPEEVRDRTLNGVNLRTEALSRAKEEAAAKTSGKKPGKPESSKAGKTDNAKTGNKSGKDTGKEAGKDAGKENGKNAGKESGKTPAKNTGKKTPEEKSSVNQEKVKPAPSSADKAPADAGAAAPAMKNAVPGDKADNTASAKSVPEKSASENAPAPGTSGKTPASAGEDDSGMGLDRLHVLENEVGSPGTTAPDNDTARGGK